MPNLLKRLHTATPSAAICLMYQEHLLLPQLCPTALMTQGHRPLCSAEQLLHPSASAALSCSATAQGPALHHCYLLTAQAQKLHSLASAAPPLLSCCKPGPPAGTKHPRSLARRLWGILRLQGVSAIKGFSFFFLHY